MLKQVDYHKFSTLLKIIHLLNLIIFISGAAYIFVYALHRAGQSWLFIASLSGYSAIILLFLLSFYLFAVYRGISDCQNVKDEHPLTTSFPYLLFYNVSSFYGILLGWLMSGANYRTAEHLLNMSEGAAAITFLVWIIIDPIAGFVEMLLPSSRKHRRARIAQIQENRKREYEEKCNLLKEVHLAEQRNKLHWQQILEEDAKELSRLIIEGRIDDKTVQARVIELGVKAFRIGGIECMRHLYSMAGQICKRRPQVISNLEHIPIWWDGIGNWRSNWMEFE